MMTRKQSTTETFAAGDRVMFNTDPTDRLDGEFVPGEIVRIVHYLAVIRPDNPLYGSAVIVSRRLQDIRKETS
jgi:hypothetical protein